MVVTYPEEKKSVKTTFGVGDRVDIAAKRTHEVWIGDEGCVSVIGE